MKSTDIEDWQNRAGALTINYINKTEFSDDLNINFQYPQSYIQLFSFYVISLNQIYINETFNQNHNNNSNVQNNIADGNLTSVSHIIIPIGDLTKFPKRYGKIPENDSLICYDNNDTEVKLIQTPFKELGNYQLDCISKSFINTISVDIEKRLSDRPNNLSTIMWIENYHNLTNSFKFEIINNSIELSRFDIWDYTKNDSIEDIYKNIQEFENELLSQVFLYFSNTDDFSINYDSELKRQINEYQLRHSINYFTLILICSPAILLYFILLSKFEILNSHTMIKAIRLQLLRGSKIKHIMSKFVPITAIFSIFGLLIGMSLFFFFWNKSSLISIAISLQLCIILFSIKIIQSSITIINKIKNLNTLVGEKQTISNSKYIRFFIVLCVLIFGMILNSLINLHSKNIIYLFILVTIPILILYLLNSKILFSKLNNKVSFNSLYKTRLWGFFLILLIFVIPTYTGFLLDSDKSSGLYEEVAIPGDIYMEDINKNISNTIKNSPYVSDLLIIQNKYQTININDNNERIQIIILNFTKLYTHLSENLLNSINPKLNIYLKNGLNGENHVLYSSKLLKLLGDTHSIDILKNTIFLNQSFQIFPSIIGQEWIIFDSSRINYKENLFNTTKFNQDLSVKTNNERSLKNWIKEKVGFVRYREYDPTSYRIVLFSVIAEMKHFIYIILFVLDLLLVLIMSASMKEHRLNKFNIECNKIIKRGILPSTTKYIFNKFVKHPLYRESIFFFMISTIFYTFSKFILLELFIFEFPNLSTNWYTFGINSGLLFILLVVITKYQIKTIDVKYKRLFE